MFQNQRSRAATPAELAVLKAEAVTLPYAGFSPAQIVAALAAPRTVPNPAPPGPVPLDSIPTAAMETFLLEYLTPVLQLAATSDDGPTKVFCSIYQAKLAALQNSRLDTVPVGAALQADLALMVRYGVITQAEAEAVGVQPDPAYTPTITGGPRAFALLGDGILPEASDIAAALAS